MLDDTLGLRPKDQSCHHEVWLHLAVEHQGDYEPRESMNNGFSSRKDPAPYQPSKESGKAVEDESDRSAPMSTIEKVRTIEIHQGLLVREGSQIVPERDHWWEVERNHRTHGEDLWLARLES